MTETEFQADIIERCHRSGLLVFHSTDPTRDVGKGFPDLVIAGPGGHMFAELKMLGGRMKPEQTDWAWKLRAARAPYEVWTPRDQNLINWRLIDLSAR